MLCLVRQRIHALRKSMELFEDAHIFSGLDCSELRILSNCSSSKVVDILVFTQLLFPMVLFVQKTIEISKGIDQKDSCSDMYSAGVAGDIAPCAVFVSLVGRPKMLVILAVMDQKDSGSDMYYAGFAGDYAPRAVFLGWQAHVFQHHGRYGPDGQLRHCAHVQTADYCGVSAVAVRSGRRHPFRSAEADPHGPGNSADHRDSPVAVRFPVVDALCCAGRAGSLPRRGAEASSMVQTARLTMGHSTVAQHGGRCPCCAVPQFSSADVEETVELPQLQLVFLRGHCRAHSCRMAGDELMG